MISSSAEATTTSPALAILPNWLGDLVMAQPALARLRQRGPLVAVGEPAFLELLRDGDQLGPSDGLVEYRRRHEHAGWRGLWSVGRQCAAHRPSVAYAFPPSLRAAALAFSSRAPRRVGGGGEGRSLFLNHRPPESGPARSVHLADTWLSWVEEQPVESLSRPAMPVFRPGPRGKEGLQALRAEHDLPPADAFCVVAPSATYGPTKRWPMESFERFASILESRFQMHCVYVAGKDRSEGKLCETLASRSHGISLAGRTNLLVLAALLEEARLFVGNDSGPMHLAAAVGTSTVGIFGSTSPAWTAPRGIRASVVGPAPVHCTPCFSPRCRFDLECLRDLTVDAVVEAATLHLGSSETQERS